MPIRIVVVGQDRNDPLKIEAERYLSRTHARLKCDSFYVRESKRKDDPRQAMDEEGKEILKHTQGYYRIAMDLSGKMMSSEAFAKKIEERLLYQPLPIAFIIGGATGLSPEVLAAVNEKCALSPMTLPHRLAFLVLAEQVYRAGEILRGGPYHK